ncbi:sodium/hydrogen exchanger, Na+, H+ antiporter, putative [Plasmodium relictum]|uniref:Sodium/hydrogen exchanger, Na+, H+ antiporter, putative n=1 Tax=Plasmodium relictum TaxID=85471 RepID=A0A1J1HA34_PLARL|nr:sodium/hydrogen exchanger, Na+, H+ antiporter, putative [Plasmodium relictum]CRH02283.1 sodium/hydrogen exchanger, Na+, H+ antiporter, putative [Plasmodium relictum]
MTESFRIKEQNIKEEIYLKNKNESYRNNYYYIYPNIINRNINYFFNIYKQVYNNISNFNIFHKMFIKKSKYGKEVFKNEMKIYRILNEDETKNNQLPTASNEVSEGLIFFCFIFISATMLQFILSKIHKLNIPVSVIWFLYGMCTYVIAKNFNVFKDNPLHKSIINARNIDSSILYFVLLPILLYEATQDINYYAFKNFLYGGIGLAVIGVALQVGILGILFYYSYMYQQEQSPVSSSFLLASILSSTDPVAVLSILSVVDAPSKISSMFHVESLINDGSSVLLFQFFFYLTIGYKANTSQYVILFVKLLFLSPVFGIGMAMLTFAWINLYRKYYYNQCLATITMCYLCYFISEYYFNLSGPLAIVCYGLFINAYGHIALDEIAQRKHKEIVELLALMGNSSIFIISGIVSFGMMESVFKDNLYFFLYIILTYFYLLFARSLMILIFTPFLSKIGYHVNWKEILLLIWGGLRGGIVLVLGLRIEAANEINDKLTKELAYYISGSVLLILTIQGLTFECLYKVLNTYPPNPFRIVYLEKVLKMIDYNFYIRKKHLKNYWLFKGTNILHFSTKIVPELHWRKMNKFGEFDLNLPDIYSCLQDISTCDISVWENAYYSQTVIDSFDDLSSHSKKSDKKNINKFFSLKKSFDKKVEKSDFDPKKLTENIYNDDNNRDNNNNNNNNNNNKNNNNNNDNNNDKIRSFERNRQKNYNLNYKENHYNSDEYSYIKNYTKRRNYNNKNRKMYISRRNVNPCKHEMRINIIRNNDNYCSSLDEDDCNYANVNHSISSKNFDRSSNNLNELSDNESSCTEKDCEENKINLNAFNYDKISLKNYDRLINKMNYKQFKRKKHEKEHITVIDNIVNNNNEKETFDPKYNLRLIEHATDLPKTLSDNLLFRSNVNNSNLSNDDKKNNDSTPNKKKKKKKKLLNFLSDPNTCDEEVNKKESKEINEQFNVEKHVNNNVNYDIITKVDESLLSDYKDLKKKNSEGEKYTDLSNLEKNSKELLMNDDFIVKIKKEKLNENEKESCNNSVINENSNYINDIITNEEKSKDSEYNFDEYLTYQNLFALQNNGENISSFFNNSYDKKYYLKKNEKNLSEINISTKGTNSKSLILMNKEIERNKDKNKCRCSNAFENTFNFFLCKLRRKNFNNKLKRKIENSENKNDNEKILLNNNSTTSNIMNEELKNSNKFDDAKRKKKLQRNNTADIITQRYDTDQTINFECIEDVCQKKYVTPFYSFLKKPKKKIKNKLFSELRRARSHESYTRKGNLGKNGDDVFYTTLKKKIVRKEREGELYIMIFNTCRELYKKLYVNGFISGECLLTLTSILDLSADFALKKVRMNPIKAWAEAFDKRKDKNNNKKNIDHRNGFEYEFHVLLSKLKINKKNFFFFSPKVVNIFIVYEHCMKDLQIVLSYVDVHQCTLDKGGITMKLLLGKNLLKSYYRNIELAKNLIPHIANKYRDVVKYCLIKIGTDMLLHLKKTIVNEQAANGLLLSQDNEKLNGIFDEQQVKINRYRPYLHYIFKKNMLKMIIK